MKKSLQDLTKKEFDTLKQLGLLWEHYPEAPESWTDIKRKEKINVDKLNDEEIDELTVDEISKVIKDVLSFARKAIKRYNKLKCCANCKYYLPKKEKCRRRHMLSVRPVDICDNWEYEYMIVSASRKDWFEMK